MSFSVILSWLSGWYGALACVIWSLYAGQVATAQVAPPQQAPPPAQVEAIEFGSEPFRITIPASWQRKAPASPMVAHEFVVQSNTGDATGRVTMMTAGGSVEANLDRWRAQFTEAEASNETRELAGTTVHLIRLSGTYQDRPRGPLGPAEPREDYRMLGAIFETGGDAFFVKFYGPEKLVKEAEPSFEELVNSLRRGE